MTAAVQSIYCKTPGCPCRLGTRTQTAVVVRNVKVAGKASVRCQKCGKWWEFWPIATDAKNAVLV